MDSKSNKPKFETASATTDPENSNSGPFAYVVTAVCLGGALVLGLIGAGCTSLVLSTAMQDQPSMSGDPSSSTSMPYPYGNDQSSPFGNDDTGLEDLEELFNYYGLPYGSTNGQGSTSGTSSSTDVLDYQLAPYGDNLDDCVGANSYAGTPAEVREFVRGVVQSDKDYTKEVVNLMYDAARNEDARTDSLTKAAEKCAEASKAFSELEVPKVEKDKDGTVGDLLGSAKSKVVERWNQMKDELELINTTDEIDNKKLWRLDEDVVDATEDAGDLLEDAMDRAASL